MRALQDTGEQVLAPPPPPTPAASPQETEQVLRWLEQPNVRLVHLSGSWSSPIHGAVGARSRLEPAPSPADGRDRFAV